MKGHKIHLAGTYPGGLRRSAGWSSGAITDEEARILIDYPYLLESFHYIGKSQKIVEEIRSDQRKVFLDSGAFSMHTQGIDIHIDEYVDFIKRNHDIIEVASVLDGIGDPEQTLYNQHLLEDKGVEVLPCFHYGEPLKYLEGYLSDGYPFITLGGMVPISTGPLEKWLDTLWGDYLTDDQGMPKVKVHGFGLTVLRLMLKYPWYSVDSTSWVLTGRFGSIYWPTKSRPGSKLIISGQSPKVKEEGKHYDNLTPIEREHVRAQIEAKGFDPEELRSIYWKRDLWNIEYFRSLCDRPLEPFFNRTKGLF